MGTRLNIYQGDLDANPNDNVVTFLASGNLNMLVRIDRQFGRTGLDVALNCNRFFAEFREEDMANNLLGFNLPSSVGLTSSDLLRLYVAVGPLLIVPEYYRFPDDPDGKEFDKKGTRVIGGTTIVWSFKSAYELACL